MSENVIEATSETPQNITTSKPRLSDWQRFKQVGTYHGIATLALVSLFAVADVWFITTGLFIAKVVSVLNALVAGSFLARIFHEWGHFAGARIAKSYSPIVPKVTNEFVFGFNFSRNTSSQFLSMSLGGPLGNWLLVLLVFVFVPMDNPGRLALLAMVIAKAISVCIFEGPVILRTLGGGDPETELETALSDGSGDRGQVLGYLSGIALWLVLV